MAGEDNIQIPTENEERRKTGPLIEARNSGLAFIFAHLFFFSPFLTPSRCDTRARISGAFPSLPHAALSRVVRGCRRPRGGFSSSEGTAARKGGRTRSHARFFDPLKEG